MFIVFIPVYMFLFMPARMLMYGETAGFIKAAGTLHWGLMTTVFSLSHAAFLLALPNQTNPAGAAPAPIVVSLPTPSVNPSAQHSITQYESTKELVQTIPVTIQITNYVF